jgi:hypothetical protein
MNRGEANFKHRDVAVEAGPLLRAAQSGYGVTSYPEDEDESAGPAGGLRWRPGIFPHTVGK